MSELEAVLAEALPVMSTAVGAYGAGILSRMEDATADATLGLGRRLVQWVRHHSRQPSAVEAAVAELAQEPIDPDALAALRLQVRKVLAQDPELLMQLSAMLPGKGAVSSPGAGAVAVGGDNRGVIGTGAGAVSLSGAAVVVNPFVPGPGRG